MSRVIAILVSDVHLCHTPPPARAGEPNWYAAMRRPLDEIRQLAYKERCPVVYAGDIFDRWGPPVELVNFAIDHLPHGYAIYGQHDMPNHAVEEFDRTAYATLCRTGKLCNILPGTHDCQFGELVLHGFPWNVPLEPLPDPYVLHMAVCHRYIWTQGHGYTGADAAATPTAFAGLLQGYQVAHFGDNHSGFIAQAGDCVVANCGAMMRRRSDEGDYRPWVGLLGENGSVRRHYLDTSKDVFDSGGEVVVAEQTVEMQAFFAGLVGLQQDELDFRVVVNAALSASNVSEGCKRRVLEAVG